MKRNNVAVTFLQFSLHANSRTFESGKDLCFVSKRKHLSSLRNPYLFDLFGKEYLFLAVSL